MILNRTSVGSLVMLHKWDVMSERYLACMRSRTIALGTAIVSRESFNATGWRHENQVFHVALDTSGRSESSR